jgi:hypothetical protein
MGYPSRAVLSLLAAMPAAMAQTAEPPAPPASQALASSAPVAGRWEFSVTTEGGPGSNNTQTGSACLAAEPLNAAPERTLFEAALRNTGGRPKGCKLEELRRESARSSWSATCGGPMGVTLKGPGSGTFDTGAATLSQKLEGTILLQNITLVKAISAKRVGGC